MTLKTRGRTISAAKIRKRFLYGLHEGRARVTRPSHTSAAEAVYHCCVHKTGSQWLRHMLADWRVFKASGLRSFQYQSQLPGGFDDRPIHERTIDGPIPPRSFVSPIYIGYDKYLAIPKPADHRAFFVQRDPRDVAVSWYFSSRYSHPVMGKLGEVRQTLDELPITEGLRYSITHLNDFGAFGALGSWAAASKTETIERQALVVKYEDLVGPQSRNHFRLLFAHLDVGLSESQLAALLADHSFEKLSGRDRGEEKQSDLMRKGVSGDWANYFDDDLTEHFAATTGALLATLGYE